MKEITEKEFMFEQIHINSDSNNVFVYKVTNNCGQNHLTTFDFDRAYDKLIERKGLGDYPNMELIQVER